MMLSRKDNVYIIRTRGSISSVKPRWWDSNTFRLSSTRYVLLCFLLKEVKVPWKICLFKCFTNTLINADIWWYYFYGKIHGSFISKKNAGIRGGPGAHGKSYFRNYVQRRDCAQWVLVHPGHKYPRGNGSLFLLWHSASLIAVNFKAGKTNTTARSPGLFSCKTTTFAEPFSGGKQVKAFASFGHSVNNQADRTQFRACIYEYSNGSNSTAEINWIALQSAPKGAQLGTTSLGYRNRL